MRQLTFIFLIFFILTSCSNEKTSNTENDVSESDSLKKSFTPIFKGIWVLTDYINKIEKTRSPLKSADKLKGVVTMIIDGTDNSDSIEIGASWNNHEGYNFTTYFLVGQNSNRLKTNIPDYVEKSNFYELGYETINDETFLFLYHYEKTNKLLDKKQFSKVAETQPDNDAAWGLQYIVNVKLFSGNYLLIDSLNSTTKISFENNGSLTGDSEFKTYYIFTDFMGGPETNLDGIIFNMDTKNSEGFAFTMDKDTTYLYNTKGEEEAGELLQLNKVKYRLVRQ
jgi:hypothetical protein